MYALFSSTAICPFFCNIGSDANFDVFSVVPLDLKPGSGGSHAVQELGEHAGLFGIAGKFCYLS
jgi:hypothetical protein